MSDKKSLIYQAKNGAIELRVDANIQSVWASQKQIAEVFGVTPQNITIHLKQIFSEKELQEQATCKESLQVQKEGTRQVTRKIKEYNLDVIIAVGYRINSVIGTKFRIWATKTLKQHITQGYTINKNRIEKNYQTFMQAVEDVKLLAKNNIKSDDVLELIQSFSNTWLSLEAFDEDTLPKTGISTNEINVKIEHLYQVVRDFKQQLIQDKQATELFASEKTKEALGGIFTNIFQSAFGKDIYPSIEEKAAHLLYFIVKNHPFNDGNKRTGAFSFIWFLKQSGFDFYSSITPETLTTLTLLIATSNPKEKDKLIGLVLLLLKVRK